MKPYYEHAGITIYNADCREVLPTLGPVDLVLTDPPYGTQELGGGYGRRKLHSTDGRNGRMIANDLDLSVFMQVLPQLRRMVSVGWLASFCAARRMNEAMEMARLAGFRWYGHIVWDKLQPGLGYSIRYAHEDALIFQCGEPPKPDPPIISVVRCSIDRIDTRTRHPHDKPVPVLMALLGLGGSMVLDPFMGGGSTLVAAKAAGKTAIGIELSEQWCENAAKRLSQEMLPLVEPEQVVVQAVLIGDAE